MQLSVSKYLKLMMILFFLMGLQVAPGLAIIPFSDALRFVLVLIFLILAICASGGRIQACSLHSQVLLTLLSALYLWAVFTSIADGQYVLESFRRATLAIGTSLVVLSAFLFYRPKPSIVKSIVWSFVIIATFVSLVGLIMSFFGGGYTPTGEGQHFQSLNLRGIELTHIVHFAGGFPRISAITPNPNTLGFYAGLACVFVIGLYFLKQKSFIVFLPLFLINFMALLHSFSRAAMLGLFVAAVCVVFFSTRKRFLWYVILSFLLAFLIFIFLGNYIAEFLSARSDQGLSSRDNIWSTAFEAFLASPIYGVGFGLEMEKIMDPAGIEWSMHNAYIVVLTEMGIVGFIVSISFLLLFLFNLCYRLWREHDNEKKIALSLILSSIVFIMIRSIFESAIFRFTFINLIFFVLIGLALFMVNKPKDFKRAL